MTEDAISALEMEFRPELPRILRMSDSDLDGALAAIDRYLDRQPSDDFRKSLLAWKGHFYLEHERYEDAVLVLRLADGLRASSDLNNFNTKLALAKALASGHDGNGAYDVLVDGLAEMADPPLLLKLLRALVDVTASTGRTMPAATDTVLLRAAQFYGLDTLSGETDSAAVVVWLEGLVHDCARRFDRLFFALRRAEGTAERNRLVAEYVEDVSVPYFKQLAKDCLQK